MIELARAVLADTLPPIEAANLTVRLLDPASQHLVSGGAVPAVNTVLGDDPYWLWLGPDRGLVVADTVPTTPHAEFVSDVTDGLALFELRGPAVPALLAQGCPLDIDALVPGTCAQTLFAGVKVVLYSRHGAMRLHIDRPLAGYLHAWLVRAASAPGLHTEMS